MKHIGNRENMEKYAKYAKHKGKRLNDLELLEKVKGIHTPESIIALLNVNKIRAIKIISRLRKKGYVKTKRLSNNKRVYDISFQNRIGGKTYYDTLNENSPVKLIVRESPTLYGKEPSPEETLVFALKTKSLRTILSSLALFKKINNWPSLYQLSKPENLQREIGALYELSRLFMKTRKMSKRFENMALPKKNDDYLEIIPGLQSENFKEIEKKWKVHIPFNKADLEDYK